MLMKTSRTVVWSALLGCAVALLGPVPGIAEESPEAVQIANLVRDLSAMDDAELEAMKPLPVRRWQLPRDGVHVMRATIEETYAIEGVGEDTVELSGWIAVWHGNVRPAPGAEELDWNSAVVDTEFVGLELDGHSDLFGPVEVRLRSATQGQVGRIQIPELAEVALSARYRKHGEVQIAEGGPQDEEVTRRVVPRPQVEPKDPLAIQRKVIKKDVELKVAPEAIRGVQPLDPDDLTLDEEELLLPGACAAPIDAEVSLPQLGLKLHTERPVYWYSLVDTIPPVGHTASITVEPVALIGDGRAVGTLVSGVVRFREVVQDLPLDGPGRQEMRMAASAAQR